MVEQFLKTMISLVLFCLLGATSAVGLEIVYPADGTSVVRNDYIIFKGGEPAIDAFTLEVDGVKSQMLDISSPQYRQLMKDKVILPANDPSAPLFSEKGKHKIVVEGYKRGETQWEKVSAVEAEFYYNPDPMEPSPAGFDPYVLHIPEQEAKCAACHDMNPDTVAMNLDTAQTNPCGKCHKRMLNKKHVHGPAGVMRCADCHDPASGPGKYAVAESDLELCNGCHEDKSAEYAGNKFIHGPVGAGLCLICHDAHASDQVAQVILPVNDLCLGCHETLAQTSHVVRGVSGKGHPLSDVGDPSRPGRDLDCTGCHDPHGGNSRYFFQGGASSRFSLCQICHKK